MNLLKLTINKAAARLMDLNDGDGHGDFAMKTALDVPVLTL